MTTKALELSQLAKGLTVDSSGNITVIALDNYLASYVTNNSLATQSYVSTAISNLIDAAPTSLDTLNELAAALNDDSNFASTVTTALGTKLNTSDFTTTANTWLGTKSTSNLSEGTNLYYTDSRFDTRFATKSTTNLSEGTNQYFTTARARSSLSGSTIISYNTTTGVIDVNNASIGVSKFDSTVAATYSTKGTSIAMAIALG